MKIGEFSRTPDTIPHRTVFKRCLDIRLRNMEIGHQKGAGFARAKWVESKEDWITAAAALDMLKLTMEYSEAIKAICSRTYDGVVRARAEHYIWGTQSAEHYNVPKEFWWARGGAALDQNWKTGDFETWTNDHRFRLKAYNVSFLRADIEKMIPADRLAAPPPARAQPPAGSGGRPPADWWEDCLIDLCFKHFRGELPHKTQADIVRAIQDWATAHGHDVAESTAKLRARKLMHAINRDEVEN